MTDPNVASNGDGGETIATFQTNDTSAISPRDAANAISQWRFKRDANEDREQEPSEDSAPVTAANEPEEELAEEANAAPHEEATGDETEASDPVEEQPPLELPRSWAKDKATLWSKLDRASQEYILEHDRTASGEVRRGQNELAEQRKAIDAERSKLSEALQQYELATKNALEVAQQASAGEFADVKTQDDVSKMAAEDPLRFTRYQAHLMKIAQIEQANRQAQEQIQQQYKAKWSEFASKEDALFVEKAPEMADKEKATKVADASVSLLKDIGFSESDLAKLWNGEASLSLRDHRAQLLIRDAVRYREAQKAAPKKIAQKPIPKVQRPGVAPTRGDSDELRVKNLEKQLERSGNWKDAAALLLARREASARQ